MDMAGDVFPLISQLSRIHWKQTGRSFSISNRSTCAPFHKSMTTVFKGTTVVGVELNI